MSTEALPGYDIPTVEGWVAAHVPALKPPFRWNKLQGGHSNLTYLIEDAVGTKAVIRRPPMGELLPMAHDMAREWSLISALGPTPVPVPRALAFCEDRGVTGALFYVMGHVDGRPLYTADDTRRLVPEAQRHGLGFAFIDALAHLHALEPDAIGLGSLGKRENYVGRQLTAWYRSWTSSAPAADYDDPRAHALHDLLRANIPAQGPARVVHGDYGLHNCLVSPRCDIAAVVDWEISTLGDPLADLAYALNQWPDPTDSEPRSPTAATSVAGFPTRSELAQRYAQQTGRDLSRLDYFVGFNRWKSAAIVHGVYARYCEGKKSSEGVDLDNLRARIGQSLALAEQTLVNYRA